MNNEMERLLQEQREQIALLQQAARDKDAQLERERRLRAQETRDKERETDRANRAEQEARDRDKLENGTYFSPIDDILKKVDKDIHNHGFNYSFSRHHHVVINDNDHRYEETVIAATKQKTGVATDQTPIAATKQTATAATGNSNEHKIDELGEDAERSNNRMNSTADSSSRSKPTDKRVDIFGVYSHAAHSAHLLPNAPGCSRCWISVVPCVLSMGQRKLSWDILQNCIHGTNDSTGKKIPNVGIKHFPTNRIRLLAQAEFLDKYPCVIIIPIMTLEGVRDWNGGKYDAIVLAGDWKKDGVEIPAASVYKDIRASQNVLNDVECLAKKDQCEKACILLEQFIVCVCQSFNDTGTPELPENLVGDLTKKEEINKFAMWKAQIDILKNKATAPVPVSNDWNDDTMKVRKVSFADSKEKENPAPDPVLLLAKAASNWLKRHGIEILPVCGDDDSSTSYSDEESAQRYSHAAKKPCVVEFNINVNRDDVEEPLSDDEFLLDA